MTYGSKISKDGRAVTGSLLFAISGKRVFLTHAERQEFEEKLAYWKMIAIEQHDQLCKVSR